ncbi:hypothetical protein BJF79_12880 [Actinomadura sp. CNU-125]|uniref:hypothetical protein n=1 Tax=Actinomadura sp. CNU-125 TaxID=1904961 RepID=UPI00096941C0|nr:hypothetical protein [Actinomadura sp. CNU-125]OLT25457.1 hypothetical protein BJF79_12880 [Actinomadura sp. CNU-125]
MKRVMTGALVAAMVAAGGISGTAAAAEPRTAPQQAKDCRTYSSTTECGDLRLTEKQRTCVSSSVRLGMTERRAEVECRAFG